MCWPAPMCSVPGAGSIRASPQAATGDVSRVANINDVLWSRLFLDNRQCLVEELDELQRNLDRFRQAVDRADEEELRRLLRAAAQIKREVG